MIDSSPEKYIRQGNHYYSKVKKKLPTYPNDLEFMNKQLNKTFCLSFCGDCAPKCSRITREFQRAFKTLNQLERSELFYKYAHLTYNCLFNVPESAIEFIENRFASKVFILNSTTWKWMPKQIEINFQQSTLRLIHEQISINLRNYIMRHSRNKQRKGIVLESTSSNQYIETLRMSNYEGQFEQFQKKITSIMKYFLKERISKRLGKTMMMGDEKSNGELASIEEKLPKRKSNEQIFDLNNNQVSFNRLQITAAFNEQINEPKIKVTEPAQQNIKSFEEIRHFIEDSHHSDDYTFIRENVFFDFRNQIMRKTYAFEVNFEHELYLSWICDNLSNSKYFTKYKKDLLAVELLDHQQNVKLFHETYQVDNRIVAEFTFKRYRFINSNTIYYFDKQAPKRAPQPYMINFSIIKIDKSDHYINITEECRVQLANNNIIDKRLELCDAFLGDISLIIKGFTLTTNMSNQVVANSHIFEQNSLSKIRQLSGSNFDDFFSIQDVSRDLVIEDDEENMQYHQISRDYIAKEKAHYNGTYLTLRHPVKPFPKSRPNLRYSKTPGKHPLWESQFEVNQDGEITFLNMEKVKSQKGILKEIFKLFGKKIITGKNIFNISLPVTLNGAFSMISNICNSLVYAPWLLETAANQSNPVERLKYVVLFDISSIIAEMQIQMPFNPILGETYQSMIDGCPVYAEQISHHPPISAFLMKGRGYTLHGHFQIKPIFGLNSISAFRNGVMSVEFDDGGQFRYKSCSAQLSGLIYGDRKIRLMDSSHYIDVKNRNYLQLKFGQQRGITQYSKLINGVQGKVVKINSKADINKFWLLAPDDVVEQYGFIKGRWTDEIFYDEQCVFNSWKDLPFIPTPYPYSLESDSLKRLDLKERAAENNEKAQQFKEDLQNIQRNDRKLRLKYKS